MVVVNEYRYVERRVVENLLGRGQFYRLSDQAFPTAADALRAAKADGLGKGEPREHDFVGIAQIIVVMPLHQSKPLREVQ